MDENDLRAFRDLVEHGALTHRERIASSCPATGSSGALTGYAGGLERKRWLLRHEGAMTVEVAIA